jgi:predicted transcriptional regulator of viral defense system
MSIRLGEMETRLLAYTQSRPGQTLHAGDMVRVFAWTAEQERKVLSRLSRKGIIARVRRGLYLAPPRLPPGGHWSPGEFLAIATLMDDQNGRYQISGPNAFHRYGWTEQVPNRFYVYNNRISGDRAIGPVAITLIKVADERLGGTETIRTPDGIDVIYANKARSLVDAVHDWSRFDSLPSAFDWIRDEVATDSAFTHKLIEATILYGNQGTIRRIGALLELIDGPEQLLRKLEKALRSSTTFIPWIPNRPKRGTTHKRWKVAINDERYVQNPDVPR